MTDGQKDVLGAVVWVGLMTVTGIAVTRMLGAHRKAALAQARYWETLADGKRAPWVMYRGQDTALEKAPAKLPPDGPSDGA